MHAVANPLINITLQGRHDTYPKRRGMTRVPEFMAAGVNVAFGHDCVMDPWYALGSGDMLEVAAMGLHVAQMTSVDEMGACFDAVTRIRRACSASTAMDRARLPGGLRAAAGARPVEAIRLRAPRLKVFRAGRVIAETPAATALLRLDGRPSTVDWSMGTAARQRLA